MLEQKENKIAYRGGSEGLHTCDIRASPVESDSGEPESLTSFSGPVNILKQEGKDRKSSRSSVELYLQEEDCNGSLPQFASIIGDETKDYFTMKENLEAYEPTAEKKINVEHSIRDDDGDDYSASIRDILERKMSTKKKGRTRKESDAPSLSSQLKSKCLSTAINFLPNSKDTSLRNLPSEKEHTDEEINDILIMHREVLVGMRSQTWPLQKKLKLVRQAKQFIRHHEGELQQRLTKSRKTRDILANCNLLFRKNWYKFRREFVNFVSNLVPWESQIKSIESHFGSVVASYFTFLRWLVWMNLMLTILFLAFVILPEVLAVDKKGKEERKIPLPTEKKSAYDLTVLWNFEGILRYSAMFYGFYSNQDRTAEGYRVPFAYFLTGMGAYVYSFVVILRK